VSIRAAHQIDQSAWSTNEDIAALAELLNVILDLHTAIAADSQQFGAIGDASALVENLVSKFASWHDDDDKWLSADLVDTFLGNC